MIHQPGVVRGVLARVRVCVVIVCAWALFMQRLVVITGLSQGWKNINPKLNLDELQQIVKPEGTNRLQTHTQLKNAQEWKLCLCGNQNHHFNANSLPICSRDAPILNNAILGQYQHQCLKLNFSWEPIQIILACFIGGGEGHWVIYSPLWPRTSSNLPVQNWWNTTWSNGMGKY